MIDSVIVWGDEKAIRQRITEHWQAGADHIFRTVRFVCLRNEASAMVEQILDCGRELGKRADRKMADEIGSGMAIDVDVAGDVEGR